MTSRRHLLTLLASSPVALASASFAQSARAARAATTPAWPTQTLKILVGFPPGSTPDLAARAISEPLSKLLGQAVVVENRPGASGNIAADLVAKATDNHTLGVMINGNLTVAKMLNPAVPFDPAKAFSPLSLIGVAPLLMVVAGNATGANPYELLQWARNLGDKANYGTPGNGTVGHLGMELIKSKTGITAVHVPFAGNPQVINALLGGQLQLALLPPGLAAPHLKTGKLKAVGITSPVRSSLVPELPTLRDAEVRGADFEIWTAAVASSSMPKAISARLSAALVDAIRTPEARQRLLNVGWQAVGTSPEGLANRMKSDTALLGGIIQMRGITAAS
jgi:tripartite-type tricarboxylate transporter receptor subunit TctC